jgi:hypothetical protein
MKLLIDMNLSPRWVSVLEEAGWKTVHLTNGISEEDVLNVLRNGRRETSEDGKQIFLHDINEKFKYPVKVIAAHGDKGFVIISTYPFIKRKKK